MLLGTGQIDSDVIIQLSEMCQDILEAMSASILETVAPQIQSRMYGQTAQEGNGNAGNTFITK